MSDMPCSRDGCQNEAARSGLCWAHLKRKRLGKEDGSDLRRWGTQSIVESLMEAALRLLEVRPTDKRGWVLAKQNLLMSALRSYRKKYGSQSPQSEGR